MRHVRILGNQRGNLSGRTVGALAGTVIGGVVGSVIPGLGTALGAAIGGTVGGLAGGLYDTATAPDVVQEQQSLADKSVTTSTLGQTIPQMVGTFGEVSFNIFLSTDKEEVQHRESQSASGKGGGPQQITVTKTYKMSFAAGLCYTWVFGPMAGISKITKNGNLFYDRKQNGPTLPTGWTFYPGTADQPISPWIESIKGVGKTSRYPYLCYVTVEDDDLGQAGQLNQYNLTLYQDQVGSTPLGNLALSPTTGHVWLNVAPLQEVWEVHQTTRAIVNTWSLSTVQTTGFTDGPMAVDSAGLAWAGNINPESQSVSIVDPGVVGSVTAITLTQRPASNIVFSSGSAWMCVSNDTDETNLLRLSSGGSIIATIPLNFSSVPRLAVDGSGNVWASTATQVQKVSPGSNTVTATLSTTILNVLDLCFGADGNLYLADSQSNTTVYRVDPSGPTITHSITVGAGPVHLMRASDDYIWSANEEGSVSRINPATNTAVTTPVQGLQYVSAYGQQLAPGSSGKMWVISRNQNTATLVSTTGTVSAYRVGAAPCDIVVGASNTIWVTSTTGHNLQHVTEAGAITGLLTGNSLETVLTNLHAACGIPSGQLDLSGLPSANINMLLTSIQAARAIVAQLGTAYRFYQVESGLQLAYRQLASGPVVATIPEDDLDVHDLDSGDPTGQTWGGFNVTCMDDIQFPSRLDVAYISEAQQYQGSSQSGLVALQTTDFEQPRVEQLNIVLADSEAKQLAQEHAYQFQIQREPATTTLDRRYAYLEPGDRVSITARGQTYPCLIQESTYGHPGIMEVKLLPDIAYLVGALGAVPGSATQPPGSSLPPGATAALLLNLPTLDAADTTPRYHVAFQGITSPWPGGGLYRSVDGGSSYQLVDSETLEAIVGDVALNLPAPPSEHAVDDTNVLHVVLRKPTQTLTSVTDDAMASGQNLAALVSSDGSKILVFSFGTATLTAPGEYDLEHLLQGRRGTESVEGLIGTDAVFVLLDAGVHAVAMLSSDVGVSRDFKSVTVGGDISLVSPQTFVPTSPNLYPWEAANISAALNGVGSWDIQWCVISRLGPDWVSGYSSGWDFDALGFDVVVYADNTYAVEKRVFTVTGGHELTPTATRHQLYTATQQTADFGSPQTTIFYRVYQKSNAGRGAAVDQVAP